MKFVFEEQEEYEIRAKGFFDVQGHHLISTGESKFNSIEFISKDSSILTQPADYLAFSILQQFRDPASLKAKWCEPIRRNTQPAIGIVHDGKGLRKVIESSLRKLPEFAKKIKADND